MTDLLVLSSLRKAIHQRQADTGLIHHSDRGGSMPGQTLVADVISE